MTGPANARVAIVVARTIDRFVGKFDFAALDEGRRTEALREIARLRADLRGRSPLIDSAYAKLERSLRQCAATAARPDPRASRKLARLLRVLAPLALASAAVSSFVASPALALDTYTVGQTIVNPTTGEEETVAQLVDNYGVITSDGHYILLARAVNDTYTVTNNGTTPATVTTYKVTAVTVTDGRVTHVTVQNQTTNESTNVSRVATYSGAPPEGGGTGSGVNYVTPSGSGVPYIDIRGGGAGGDGRDGGGVCIPYIGCVQYSPGNGGHGSAPASFAATVEADWGVIETTGTGEAGIVVVSKGGKGGNGGTGYGNIPPARGGDGGNGGTVTATNETTVVTEGSNAYGMLVQSVGGRSGSGGNCYIACSGGGPGVPGNGGSATGINAGSITTHGEDAIGLIVQSSGGNSGTGGSSYGIVGDAGGGGYGGNGGNAHAVNNGFIHTTNDRAFGILAQSIGGIGGNSGNAGGIVAFSSDAGGGGSGGKASISLGENSITRTEGDWAHAVFAQSIGGGGGSSGWAGGLASFGSGGGSGGTGGEVEVNAAAGAYIQTEGIGAYGIYAESVGGSGGTAGGTGGAFTMGGSGGTGQTGGKVTVNSSATIITGGDDARGIFAQSIGGGGGSANTSGGIVSLGGSGGTGADGGEVSVTLGTASSIRTTGAGADGVFAQSVGGGGGAGAASGGLVALGGSGSVGGSGKKVTIENGGTIETEKDHSRGIFAQSIGGGGGAGGYSGGLAAIGGSGSAGGAGGDVILSNSGFIKTGGAFSSAVQAQSIGGGGGDGGSTGGALLTIGGKGGAGTDAGKATANISGGIHTTGNDSHGVFVQAIGGGGGNGGFAESVSAFLGIALGGDGAAGGNGGEATVNFTQKSVDIDGIPTLVDPWIKTEGNRSRGVYVQSVGGGGGSGGFAANLTVGAWGAVSVALGGSGASGGDGDLVKITGDVHVETLGDYSEGMLLQSIGGGGGAGGFAVAGTISAGIGASASVSVGLGGSGGAGGDGGSVEMDSGGSITTSGDFSSGLVAQSIGGGGGAGGFSVAAALSGADTAAVSVALGIGGSGGDGGVGGEVDVDFDGDITTGADGLGNDSHGALIQSVGGGGGTGGFNVSGAIAGSGVASIGVSVGLGGSGGGGGDGGEVTGSIGGNISTNGARSSGAIIQSIGGGGGAGGFNVSGTITASGATSGGVSVGLGGSGAGAGHGGTVTGSVGGTILTHGSQSDGLLVQSVGGGGGSGGFNVSGNISASGVAGLGASVGLGGSGGSGGNGGSVVAHAYDTIETRGDQSRGFIAQSIGGGGGAGAFNISGNLAVGGTGSGAVGVGLGGSGGSGGYALDVTASAKDISTYGDDSAGFIAQSIGGGGGAGGFNITAGLSFSGTASGSIGVGLGGSGGGGGDASTVDATVVGNVITRGDRSGAILAQSVGGGGGSGGFNVTGDIAAAGAGAASVSVGIGGSGGSAGDADAVTLTVTGAAQTGEDPEEGERGAYSDGIVAQSIGGGGGNGGFNVTGNIAAAGTGAGQIGVGIGGHGGGGGSAGAVTLNVNDGVTTSDLDRVAAITRQDHSAGIIAQSIGGGGGNGGFNVTGGMSFGGTGAGGVNVGIGGTGGDGNSAGAVTADISGFVQTLGDDSLGILAQSVGGGGGNGGFNVAAGLTFGMEGSGTVNVGIGGGGGKGGSGDAVTLRINDEIETPDVGLIAAITKGDRSAGVIAQSLGGGGGNGGFNVTGGINISGGFSGGANIGVGGTGGDGGSAGEVIADITGAIGTGGVNSGGLLVQSAGGGGGNGGFNVSGGLTLAMDGGGTLGVGVGGFGGNGGSGGDVTLDYNQRTEDDGTLVAVATGGDDSDAVIVQSLGGGGGNGGFNVTGNASLSMGTGAGNVGVGIGGFGGDGGASGVVTSRIAGDIGTAGKNSDALLVQSVGGGGGNGGFNVTGGLAFTAEGTAGNLGVGLGGFGGKGGAGNTVTSTLIGDVVTEEESSTGVTVQSLGGGGGNGGFNVTAGIGVTAQGAAGNIGVGVGGFGGDGGAAGSATSSITGDVLTKGADSYGLLVQSAGGGGGNGGFNVTGNLSATAQGTAANLGIGIGGFGGGGGAGDAASSTLIGNLATLSDRSNGVTVQSLGGGGGNGGFNVTADVALTAQGSAGNLGIGLGGFGGDGGVAGTAYSSITGNIGTAGTNSYALLVQSAGGGGGNGGFNVEGSLGISAQGAAGNVGVGIGGFGGGGGSASTATSILTGNVVTLGDLSSGVTVQSMGGGGGNGGFNVKAGIAVNTGSSTAGNLGVGIGGFGGDGGAGGAASSEITGNIQTSGSESYALLVQSQGGGGGNGGFNVTGGIGISSQGSAGNVGVGIGGFGGAGGSAGDVTSDMTGDIFTGVPVDEELLASNKSSGATIQSVGGGGGNGGFNVTGGVSVTMGASASGNIGVGIGGFGGSGGDGGKVTATHTGNIVTRGDESYGILVQSAGGGGGNGGFNVTGGVSVTKGSTGNAGVGIGGFGGDGGVGNAVIANLTGNVLTDGDEAYGATIQSLGGAGGSGGMNVSGNVSISASNNTSIAASVGIGGFGGGGGDAGTVEGSATGLYRTTGDDSDGVLVQSVGGGGGAGGLNVSGAIALSSGTAGSGSIGIGGFGGGGGDGNTVTFTRTGDTFTNGANSNGVVIQSIGGGGGRGGINVSGAVSATKGNDGSVGFGLGGFGGDGGNGGDVTGAVYGNVYAIGLESDEIVPVYDLSDLPEDVEITDPAELEQYLVIGEQRIRSGGSTGVLIQSVGGGGGNGGMNVTGAMAITTGTGTATGRTGSIGIGGFGGSGGNAGKVTGTVAAPEDADGRIQVQSVGDSQMAVAVQSIGGGGGAGGMNISGGISTAGQLVVGIGGFGGAGGTGGDVEAYVDADLFAAGHNSIGFLAQSVGGGGGAGGINISGGIQAATKGKEPEVVFGLGGFGGAGNVSGNVTATQIGQVMVEGQFAYGVLAQSVGGGGGAGGLNISAALTGAGNSAKKTEGIAIAAGVGGNGGTGADAGDVHLTSNGNVFMNTVITEVDGELEFSKVDGAMFAPGVVAQSIGGGGGAGGMNVTGSFAPKGVPIAIGVGGTGGVGGDAGEVTVVRGYGDEGPGLIMTYGQGSHGLVAQSIGGGGGNAGFNLVLAANKSKPKDPQYGAVVTVGGDGGSSGDGDDVTVEHKGDIYTYGGGSNGILAQSISGGGGSGATNITGALTKDSSIVSLAIGGRGGDGGNAGDVSVTHEGTIITAGAASAAIRAQSIGSGGGDASAEEDLTAFFAEDWPVGVPIPIGAKNEISVGIGDVGGKGGIAGDVTVNAAGLLITQGEDAVGIHAQSIGGAGGASSSISVGVSGENKSGSQSGGVSVSVGLEGGEGGIAGDVLVDSSAEIFTEGERSRGIFAQSIGGSGGSGGDASNDLENASNEMHISVGGPGGSGSLAGTVTVRQSGLIETEGDDADGILAQSIGGGGGAGGASGTQNLQYEAGDSNTLAIAVGGSGGNGAIAGDVSVTNTGIILTSGDQSFGIRAQSIGGGGGVGGAIDSKKMLITGTSNSLEFNVGGSGGEGSSAGDVLVINEGLIWTTGLDAAAISANSIGGGGGDAGSILDLSVSAATSNTFKANIGGTGGSGGVAGDVTVINRSIADENSGFLITEGDGAYGIFAQSLGGSGGNSSTILSISVDGGSGSVTAGFNFGNVGGTGNLAGDVLVDNAGFIDTSGKEAYGILAQSIGGGGGNGGIVLTGNINLTMPAAAPLISIGGSGGDGGDAGDVEVINSGSIVTRGEGAHGIVAQSIGGGGGNAGVGLALTGEPGSLIIGNTLAATLGATSMTGTGGEGGHVTVTHTGDITVLGKGSQAIVAESINGGGGTLKLDFDSIAAIFDDDEEGSDSAEAPDPLVVARAGSVGSTGMTGGKVTVNSTGTIGVAGEGGVAINLSSIGGGGGTIEIHGSLVSPNGGNGTLGLSRTTFAEPVIVPVGLELTLGAEIGSDNAGGDIEGSQEGAITTTEANSLGLVIQSVGGGGGRAVADFEAEDLSLLAGAVISVGGIDQVDSGGGNISHLQDGGIFTYGDFSIGGLIQSIGGGGGMASVSYSQIPAEDLGLQAFGLSPFEAIATTSTVTLGASGGTGNDGGSVNQTINGHSIAAGDYSAALILQSIGAGGGAVTLSGDTFPLVQLGGRDGAEGSGGNVSLTNHGEIGSLGVGGYGVVLQSIGGGGGMVFGDFTDAQVELSDDNVGNGGSVSFAQVGNVFALGDHSVGILAQSLGGGGGFVFGGFTGSAAGEGAGGAITLDVDGSIVAYGLDSTAVFAQSHGSLGGGNIRLFATGDIRGGSGAGLAIDIDGGADNLIDTAGTVSAVSGTAIRATSGNETVENRGAIVGNAYLGGGTNLVHNNVGASYVTISTLDLQDGSGSGAFRNDGTVELGLRAPRFPIDLAAGAAFPLPTFDDIRTATLHGVPVISQVALDGDYIQSSTGEIWYDVAFGPYASDRIAATGNVVVDGTAHLTLTWLENSNPVTLLSAGGTATDNGIEVADTIALDFSVLNGAKAIQLAFESDFGQSFLNRNQQQLGRHMDSALDVGGASGIGRLLALLGNLTEGQEDVYSAIFEELDPELLLAPAIENLDSARDFSKRVMGCDPTDRPELDACVWGRAEIHQLERDGNEDLARVDLGDTARLRIGGAVGLGDGWSVGGAFGYDALGKFEFGNQRAEGDDGEALHLGLGVARTFGTDGRGSAGLNLAAGWQKQTMTRVQDIFGPSVGTSRVRSDYLAANLNLGYSFGSGPWFVRPHVDASAIRLSLDSFDEQGLGGLGMAVDQSDEWYLAIEPKLTVGARFDQVRFTVTGGGMFANRDAIHAPMRFLGAGASSDAADINTLIDDQAFVGGVELGVDASNRFDVSVGYQGYLGSQVESHTATLNMRLRF